MTLRWINIFMWLAVGIGVLCSDFENVVYAKVMYGLCWFVLLVNLLCRALGV